MILHAVAIGVAELVVLTGDEGLDRLHVHLLEARQLAQLQDPVALQLLRSCLVLHVADGQTVGEPFVAQLGKERALAHALGAVEHDHAVELDPRLVDVGDGGDHHPARDGPNVQRVGTAQIVDEQRLHAGHAIPFRQRFEVVADGMVAALGGDCQQDALQLARRVQPIHALEVDLNRTEVGFVPARLELRPRERGPALCVPANVDTAAMDVVGDVLQPGIVAQDQREVPEGVLHLAVAVDVETVLPVRI